MDAPSPGPARRESALLMQRHDGESPVMSMKRLMQQLMGELEGLRQQQECLLKQFSEQRQHDEEHRSWVKQRFDSLDRAVQEAATAASAAAMASRTVHHSGPRLSAQSTGGPPSASGGLTSSRPMQLMKAASFEFPMPPFHPSASIQQTHSAKELRDHSGYSATAAAEAQGHGREMDLDASPRRRRQTSSSGGAGEGVEERPATGARTSRAPTARTRAAAAAQGSGPLTRSSVFAATEVQLSNARSFDARGPGGGRGEGEAGAGAAAGVVGGAAEGVAAPNDRLRLGVSLPPLLTQRRARRLEGAGSGQEPLPASSLPESLIVSPESSSTTMLLHWNSQGHLPSTQAQVQGLGHLHHHHHPHHHHHQHAHSHPFYQHGRGGNYSSGGFGSLATLFPSGHLRQHNDDMGMGSGAPLSPTRQFSPPREGPGSSSAVPMGFGHSGGGAGDADLLRMSKGAGGEGAPSLARDSMPSASVTDFGTERVETASVKHFKGIPPRLVEIYRQRADQAHWSLRNIDSAVMSRSISRRSSYDVLARPASLGRPSTQTWQGGPSSRLALLHGGAAGGGGKPYDSPGAGSGKDGLNEEGSAVAVLDPNYDHPRMIGDDDEYHRPMTLLERLRLYSVGLIRPEGRTRWDLFILLLLVWVLFASPVVICFGLAGDVTHGDWVGIVELFVDLAFTFDIFLNLRTAYYDSKGHLVTERWRIARHYLKTWFLLDLICVIPYDLITAGTMGFLSMLKLLRVIRVGKVIRMIKMYRLLRVIRLPRILERMEMFIDRGVLQVMAFILSVGLLAHLSACIFFYMAYLDGLGPQTWVAAYGVQDADLATKYLTSLYWAFTTTATVGYGDITPKTDKEKILAIFVMCLGVSLVGYVTSSITNIMAIKNAQQTNIAAKKQLVMDVLKARSVPSELSRRVYNFFDYVSSKMIKREEATLLAELPFKLRSRMLAAFHADMLSRIPAIARLPPHVLIELVSQLKPHYFVEGDVVAMQGDYVDGLYIVSEGLLEVRTYMFPANVEPWRVFEAVHKDELRHMPYTVEGRLKPRCFFGQAGVLHGGVWPATVIARNCCELYALDREGLEHLLGVQPELADMLGVPLSPVAASIAHAASLSGPGANALLPPTDRAVLLADFPIMDPAPQRGLMQSMLRSMGQMMSGGLARASATSYPHMYSTTSGGGAPAAGAAGGGGGGIARFQPFARRPAVVPPEKSLLLNGGDRSDGPATAPLDGSRV